MRGADSGTKTAGATAGPYRGPAVLAAVALCGIIGCAHRAAVTGDQSAAIPATLRIGIATVYPSIAFKEDGELKGVEVDLAHQVATDLNVKITLVELPWDELIPALRDDRIDVIMSGMSVTEDRSKLVSFTQPYLRVGQMVLIRRADFSRLRDSGAMNLPTSRVGFQRGTTGEAYVRSKLSHAQLVGFDTPDEGIAALRAGRIDFFVHDAPTVWKTAGGRGSDAALMGRYRPLTEEYLAWAVRKNDNALRERLNDELLRLRASGQLEVVLDRWITVRKITVEVKPAP